MAEKQGIPEDTPPPAYPGVYNASMENAPYPPQNPGYPTTEQQQWQGAPGYPTTAQPQGNSYAVPPPYPGPQTYTQDPKSGQPGYPAQPGYPGYQGQLGYQGQPGYQVQPGYPAQPGQPVYQGQPGYQVQPGYPVAQGAPTTMTHQQVTVVAGGGAVHYQAQIIPRDNAGLAWFSCLFCFCPLGLIAIARSNEARRAINEGNYPLAAQLGMEARRYANYAIGTGITLIVVIVVIRIALMAAF